MGGNKIAEKSKLKKSEILSSYNLRKYNMKDWGLIEKCTFPF
jgi:hypothetical protein